MLCIVFFFLGFYCRLCTVFFSLGFYCRLCIVFFLLGFYCRLCMVFFLLGFYCRLCTVFFLLGFYCRLCIVFFSLGFYCRLCIVFFSLGFYCRLCKITFLTQSFRKKWCMPTNSFFHVLSPSLFFWSKQFGSIFIFSHSSSFFAFNNIFSSKVHCWVLVRSQVVVAYRLAIFCIPSCRHFLFFENSLKKVFTNGWIESLGCIFPCEINRALFLA